MMEKLPEDFKQKWVAALRSGEYKQAKASLYSDSVDGYCCIGVAGILCGVDKSKMKGMAYFDSRPNDTRLPLPNGFPEILDAKKYEGPYSTLAHMNDNQNKTFSEIADYIEANL